MAPATDFFAFFFDFRALLLITIEEFGPCTADCWAGVTIIIVSVMFV